MTCTSTEKKNVFIIGAKSIGQYGGYETFLDKLTEAHEECSRIQYYILTKANGSGCMDETKLSGVRQIKKNKKGEVYAFKYHNANVIKLPVPQIGAAQAIAYDVRAFRWCLAYIKKKGLSNQSIIYVLACRIGPFFGNLVKEAHRLGVKVFVNPDGHEWKRAKWPNYIKKYWKNSEKLMVKSADLMICDSVNIEKYIRDEYSQYRPKTTFIAYGADLKKSILADSDSVFTEWLSRNELKPLKYYMCCGRFVPENSFETMIREFMNSQSEKDFAIITTKDDAFLEKLEQKLHFGSDPRIKFVGTVYNSELLKKIRENAYGNFHGHTVGGTNPSLLEALACTDLNLLVDVSFNREVALDSALYWGKAPGELASLIDKADAMDEETRRDYGCRAKERIASAYSWQIIADKYERVFN